jgi:TRAP-type uncharacterized transport system substrate-binding protein
MTNEKTENPSSTITSGTLAGLDKKLDDLAEAAGISMKLLHDKDTKELFAELFKAIFKHADMLSLAVEANTKIAASAILAYPGGRFQIARDAMPKSWSLTVEIKDASNLILSAKAE